MAHRYARRGDAARDDWHRDAGWFTAIDAIAAVFGTGAKDFLLWPKQPRADICKQAMTPGSGEPRPNALTAVWFQGLRHYLNDGITAVPDIKGWTAVYVDGSVWRQR